MLKAFVSVVALAALVAATDPPAPASGGASASASDEPGTGQPPAGAQDGFNLPSSPVDSSADRGGVGVENSGVSGAASASSVSSSMCTLVECPRAVSCVNEAFFGDARKRRLMAEGDASANNKGAEGASSGVSNTGGPASSAPAGADELDKPNDSGAAPTASGAAQSAAIDLSVSGAVSASASNNCTMRTDEDVKLFCEGIDRCPPAKEGDEGVGEGDGTPQQILDLIAKTCGSRKQRRDSAPDGLAAGGTGTGTASSAADEPTSVSGSSSASAGAGNDASADGCRRHRQRWARMRRTTEDPSPAPSLVPDPPAAAEPAGAEEGIGGGASNAFENNPSSVGAGASATATSDADSEVLTFQWENILECNKLCVVPASGDKPAEAEFGEDDLWPAARTVLELAGLGATVLESVMAELKKLDSGPILAAVNAGGTLDFAAVFENPLVQQKLADLGISAETVTSITNAATSYVHDSGEDDDSSATLVSSAAAIAVAIAATLC